MTEYIAFWKTKLDQNNELPASLHKSRSRIMYIEFKGDWIVGPARIGRVYFSKTRKTLYYRGLKLQSLKGAGFKSNYVDIHSGDEYWISGPRKDRRDQLYGGNRDLLIDRDVVEEYAAMVN